jgi:hypothetical protein
MNEDNENPEGITPLFKDEPQKRSYFSAFELSPAVVPPATFKLFDYCVCGIVPGGGQRVAANYHTNLPVAGMMPAGHSLDLRFWNATCTEPLHEEVADFLADVHIALYLQYKKVAEANALDLVQQWSAISAQIKPQWGYYVTVQMPDPTRWEHLKSYLTEERPVVMASPAELARTVDDVARELDRAGFSLGGHRIVSEKALLSTDAALRELSVRARNLVATKRVLRTLRYTLYLHGMGATPSR